MKPEVVFVHGMGDKVLENFADPLQKPLEKRLRRDVAGDQAVNFSSVIWGTLTEATEHALIDKLFPGSSSFGFNAGALLDPFTDYRRSRNFAINFLGDVLIYESDIAGEGIREVLLDKLRAIRDRAVPQKDEREVENPKVFVNLIGHSLGSVVIFDLCYLVRKAIKYKQGKLNEALPDAEKQRLDHTFSSVVGLDIANVVTFGSPIALFLLGDRYRRLDPKEWVIHVRDGGQWLNFHSGNDLIAYRLEPLFHTTDASAYLKDVKLYTGWNPLSAHTGYWNNKKMRNAIYRLLKKELDF